MFILFYHCFLGSLHSNALECPQDNVSPRWRYVTIEEWPEWVVVSESLVL